MIINDKGECDSMSEDEFNALHVNNNPLYDNEVDEDATYCDRDDNPSLVVTRVLTTSPHEN